MVEAKEEIKSAMRLSFQGCEKSPRLIWGETMRIQLKGVGIYLIFAVLVIVSTAEMERKWESLESSKDHVCNGTILDCIGEQEFLIGFEVNGRSLAQTGRHITYGALQKAPPCNAKIYGNCIKPKSGGNRGCDYYNRCKRGTS